MPAVTLRDLADATHDALQRRAARNNRSTEAEILAILDAAVRPERGFGLGIAFSEESRRLGLTNEDVEALKSTCKARAEEPVPLQ